MRSFDILSNPSRNIVQKTWIGGALSLLAILLCVLLISNEMSNFSEKRVLKNLYVDPHPSDEQLEVSLTINLRAAPCAILSLDGQDELQHHRTDILVKKTKIDKSGKELSVVG